MTAKEMQDRVIALMSQYNHLRTGAQRLRNAAELIAHEARVMNDLADKVKKDLEKYQADCRHPDQQGRLCCNFCNKLFTPMPRLDRGR